MRNLPKITSHLLLALLTVFCLLFTLAHSVQAIDLTKYFFPTGGPGNNMSTGEFFKVIEEPDGYFRIQKSVDPRYYERLGKCKCFSWRENSLCWRESGWLG